ncbi:MAG: AMP-binding protein [bacterium]
MSIAGKIKKIFDSEFRDEKIIYKNLKEKFSENGELFYAGELLKNASEKYKDQTFLFEQDRTISYKELYFRSIQLCEKFKLFGVRKRDKVLIYCQNSIEFYASYFAAWQIGAVCVPLNIFLHEKEIAYIINDCQPKLIFASNNLKQNLTKLQSGEVILTEQDINWEFKVPDSIKEVYPDFKIDKLDSDELCLLLYTSGTTGKPKGVMLSSKNIMTNALQDLARLEIVGGLKREKFFAVLPLFHVFAQNTCIWCPLLNGSSVVIVPKIDRKLIEEGLRKKPTVFLGFPALYGLLCLIKTAPLDSIKIFISGADALPDKIRLGFSSIYGRKICAGYGLTEAAPVVALNEINDEQATHVVGFPFVDIECEIRDAHGNSLGRNKVGNLWLKGDNIMLGYYNAPDTTKEVLRDGWLNTGDTGILYDDGRLSITGRSKDLIIHKGFNIYPQEIENVLLTHPSVFKAAVVGIEEDSSGQVPVAYVAVKDKSDLLAKHLRDLCSQNLAAYKVPRKFVCLDDLPMNATGKVDKKQLKTEIN